MKRLPETHLQRLAGLFVISGSTPRVCVSCYYLLFATMCYSYLQYNNKSKPTHAFFGQHHGCGICCQECSTVTYQLRRLGRSPARTSFKQQLYLTTNKQTKRMSTVIICNWTRTFCSCSSRYVACNCWCVVMVAGIHAAAKLAMSWSLC